MAKSEPAAVQAAKEQLRALKTKHRRRLNPIVTAQINTSWARALEIDPEGRELKYVIQDAREMLAPMAK